MGGSQKNGPRLNRSDEYGINGSHIKQATDTPEDWSFGSVCQVGSTVYFTGGYYRNTLWKLEDGSWQQLASMKRRRFAHTSACTETYILVVGGNTNVYPGMRSSVERYNIASDTWQDVADYPAGNVSAAASSVHQGAVVVSGGVLDSGPTNQVWMYSDRSRVWRQLASLMDVKWYHSQATVHNKLYVMGGYRKESVEVLSELDGQFSRLPQELPESKTHTNAVVLNNTIILAAGRDSMNIMKLEFGQEGSVAISTSPMALPFMYSQTHVALIQ